MVIATIEHPTDHLRDPLAIGSKRAEFPHAESEYNVGYSHDRWLRP
jgi:hypothetical protein